MQLSYNMVCLIESLDSIYSLQYRYTGVNTLRALARRGLIRKLTYDRTLKAYSFRLTAQGMATKRIIAKLNIHDIGAIF